MVLSEQEKFSPCFRFIVSSEAHLARKPRFTLALRCLVFASTRLKTQVNFLSSCRLLSYFWLMYKERKEEGKAKGKEKFCEEITQNSSRQIAKRWKLLQNRNEDEQLLRKDFCIPYENPEVHPAPKISHGISLNLYWINIFTSFI